MPTRSRLSTASHNWWSFIKRMYHLDWSGWHIVICASLMHVLLAAGLFIAGRAQIAPGFVDRDGIMGSFAFDSYGYRRLAIKLAGFLRSGQFANWATAAQPLHVKILALPFALLGSLLGYGTLTAEPYNVLFYGAVVGLVFLLGREVYGRRAGAMAAVAVAVWPTFLLHSMQLLKDPMFVAGSLVFVLCVTTLLTRTYAPLTAAGIASIMTLMVVLIVFVSSRAVILMLAVGLVSFVLLALRQWLQRRLLLWNMMAAVPMVLVAGLLMIALFSNHASERFKQLHSDQSGEPKVVAGANLQVASLMVRVPANGNQQTGKIVPGGWSGTPGKLARRVSSMRSRFAATYPESGSAIDDRTEFRSLYELVAYLPRAIEIGLFAPFPNTWVSAGRRVGNAGKLLAGVEISLMYLCEALGLLAVAREPRRLQLWFILAIAILGMTALGLLVPNVGALYRFRYAFWFLIIIAAMAGVENLLKSAVFGRFRRQHSEAESRRLSSLVLPS